MKNKFRILVLAALVAQGSIASAQTGLPEKLAATVMNTWKEGMSNSAEPGKVVKWSYDQGVVLEGMDAIWQRTADRRYFEYIRKSMDYYVDSSGTINTYKADDYNIDNIKNGRSLLTLYKVTGQVKYLKAATSLWEQLKKQPRTNDGGFWHKKIYPYQMWLDGLYMGEPFYTEYASLVKDEKAFDDIAKQFILMETHARDAKTGLLYHGWDESKEQQWADKTKGTSPNFWGRAMGWYAMALVDVLDYFPVNHPKRAELLAILNRTVTAIQKYQDPASGLWYQVMDKPTGKGNYHEASASCMFVYAVAKGVRKGYLPATFFTIAEKGYAGIKKEFIEPNADGTVNLKGTVSVAGLGGKPYRDGSYEYYLKEKVITNDLKGIGAFLMAGTEMEIAAYTKTGKGKTVTLDSYFNNEFQKERATGQMESFHYKWDERDNNGFQFLEHSFSYIGAATNTLYAAPDATNLKKSDVYIIVDADTEKETANPNYVQPAHVKAIADWVKAGGVLLLMGNNAGNAEFTHFNTLAAAFGIQFNEDGINMVTGNNYDMGTEMIPAGHPVFKTAKKTYLKEISTLQVKAPAKASLLHGNQVIMATATYGKGMVFAVGDPWLYNEYTDGRKLPADFDNYKAANDLAKWLVQQVKK
jgi:unsaturated rhamnogalacturonyl hydrolase